MSTTLTDAPKFSGLADLASRVWTVAGWLATAVVVVALTFGAFAAFLTVQSYFDLQLRTRIMTVATAEDWRIPLPACAAGATCLSAQGILLNAQKGGTLAVPSGAKVKLTATGGRLLIEQLEGSNLAYGLREEISIGKQLFLSEPNWVGLPLRASFTIDLTKSDLDRSKMALALPKGREFVLGSPDQQANSLNAVAPTLIGGPVQLVSSEFDQQSDFVVSTSNLGLGDSITLTPTQETAKNGAGYIEIAQDGEIFARIRGRAAAATYQRASNEGIYVFNTTLLEVILAHPALKLVTGLIGVLAVLMGVGKLVRRG